MIRVAPLLEEQSAAALALLAEEPHLNVYLMYLLERDALMRRSVVGAVNDEKLVGVAYIGRQIVLAGELAAAEAFAGYSAGIPRPKAITAPTPLVDCFWDRLPAWHRSARLIREHQPVMAVDRSTLKCVHAASVQVRRATLADINVVVKNSGEMIAGELDSDPRLHAAEFEANIRSMIESDLWWLGEYDGEVAFLCHIGSWSSLTAQMQGIWSLPHLRNKGIATAAFSAICNRLLDIVPSLCLYVNDFNYTAIALYERLGYVRVGEFRTILF